MEPADASVAQYLAGTGINFGGATDELQDDPWSVHPGRIVLSGLRGYASGFLALPAGETPTNHIERLALQAGSLAGFIGLGFPIFGRMAAHAVGPALVKFGIGANIGKIAGFRGVPMLVADKVLETVSKGQLFSHLAEGAFKGNLIARQLSQTAIHIGTASFVSALHQGVGEAAVAGLHGMALGVASGAIGNLPILKERTTMAALLRAASGAATNVALMGPGLEDAHWSDVAFQGAVGAYFGFTQPNAAFSRAHEWMRDLPRDAYDTNGNLSREYLFVNNASFKALHPEVQDAVWKMAGLYDVEDVGTALSRKWGKHVDSSDRLRPLKRTYSDRESMLRTMAEMQRIWPSMSSNPTSLAPFVKRVADKGTATFQWRDVEIGRMISSVGEKARTEGLDYPAFVEGVKDAMTQAKITFTDWKENDLFQFYTEKMTTVRKPVISVIESFVPEGDGRQKQYTFSPVSVRGKDTGGSPLSDYGPIDHMMLVGQQFGLSSDPESVYMTLDGMKPANVRDKVALSKNPELHTRLAVDPYYLPASIGEFSVPKMGVDRGFVQFQMLGPDGKPRYFAMSGAAMKDRIIYARHFFKDNVWSPDQFESLKGEMADLLAIEGAKGKPVTQEMRTKALAEVEASMQKDLEVMLKVSAAGDDPKRVADYTEAWQMSHVSNANWYKAVQMSTSGKPWERPLSDVLKGQYVRTLSDFNKRLQPLMTTFPPLPKELLPSIKYVVAHDLKDYVFTDRTTPKGEKLTDRIDEEVSDGATIITRELYDRMAQYMGFEPTGSSVKAFMLDDNPNHGLMIGKTALHVASEALEADMKAAGLNMIVFDSSAKQRGTRELQAIRPTRNGLDFGKAIRDEKGKVTGVKWGQTPISYDADGSKLFVSPSGYDKSKMGLEILKQMHNTVVWELIGHDNNFQFFRDRRSKAINGMTDMERDLLESSVAGTQEANDAVSLFDRTGSIESMERLFAPGADDRALFESADPLRLLEVVSKPGHEKAFGKFIEHLVTKDSEGSLIKSDDDQTTYFDDGESDSVMFSDSKGPADRIIRMSAGRLGPLQHKSVYARLDSLISNWIVTKLTRPYHRFGAKSVMKPYDFGLMRSIGYDDGYVKILGENGELTPVAEGTAPRLLREDNFYLEGSAFKNYRVKFGGKERTLESLFNDLQRLREQGQEGSQQAEMIRNAISSTSFRSPAVDPSAGRDLMLGGYSLRDRGYGILLHGKSMAAEGGADLDIDTTAIYWGLPESLRTIIRDNKDGHLRWKEVAEPEMRRQYGLPEEWKRVNAFMTRPPDIVSMREDATAADKLVGLFSSHQRVRLGLEVARGRNEFVSMAVSSRNVIHSLYSAINSTGKSKERFLVDKRNGIEIEFEIRPDDGLRLRAMSDAATTAGVDVAKYGALIPQEDMVLSLMNSGFRRITVLKGGVPIYEMADASIRDPNVKGFGVDLAYNRQAYEFSQQAKRLYTGSFDVEGAKVGLFSGDSPLGKIRRTNQALYGRNWGENRSWSMEERLSMIDWPTYHASDAEGEKRLPSTLGSISTRLASGITKYSNPSLLSHVLSNFNNFLSVRRMFASEMQGEGALLWDFAYAGTADQKVDKDGLFRFGGAFPQLPFRSSGLEEVLTTMARTGTEGNLFKTFDSLASHRGRTKFARDNDAWERFVKVVRETKVYGDIDSFFANEPEKGSRDQFKWRMSRINDMYRRLNDFLSNDVDDPVSLITMRDYYHVSGLRREEANLLLRKAMSIRGKAAAEFMKSRETPEQDKAYREKQAMSNARLMARDEYYQYVEAGPLHEYVDWINQRRGEGDPLVTYEKAKDFFDSTMLTPYTLARNEAEQVKGWESASRSFGADLIGEGVLGTYLDNYSRVFDYTMTKPVDGPATLRELVEASPFLAEKKKISEVVQFVGYTIDPKKGKTLSPEVEKEVSKLYDMAMRFPAFREDPKRMLDWLTKDHARVRDVTDLTLADIKSANRILQRWKSGTGLVRWIMNRKYGEEEASRRLQGIVLSMFNPRVLADQAMANDLMLIDKNTRSRPIKVRHYEEGPNGEMTVKYVDSSTTHAYSAMHQLIDVYGDQLPRLVASGHAAVYNELRKSMKWAEGKMVLARTGEDITDYVIPYSIHTMEYESSQQVNGESGTTEQFKTSWKRTRTELAKAMGTPDRMRIEDEDVTWSSRSGNTVTGKLGTLVKEIGSSTRKSFKDVAEKFILADAWFTKNRGAIMDASGRELKLENVRQQMEDVLSYGVASEGHIPLDLGRFLFHEMMVEQVADKRYKAGEYTPLSSADLASGGRAAGVLNKYSLTPSNGVRFDNLEEVALALRKRAYPEKDKAKQQELRDAANYLHQKRDGSDVRDLWEKSPFRSGWMDDYGFATGSIDKIHYARRRVREDYPLLATKLEEGFWPHLEFDEKIAGDHLIRWMKDKTSGRKAGNKPVSKEDALREAAYMRDTYNEILGRVSDPDGRSLDPIAVLHIEENPEAFLAAFGENTSSLARRTLNLDGYRTDLGVLQSYAQKLASASYGNIAGMASRQIILRFEDRKPMGEWTGAWSKWFRIYARDAMGKPSVFTQEYLDDEKLALRRTPYYYLTDHAAIVSGTKLNRALLRITKAADPTRADRAYFEAAHGRAMTDQEAIQLRDKRIDALSKPDGKVPTPQQAKVLSAKYRGLSELEAKYSMMSLLFHTKTVTSNVLGGTTNAIIQSGLRNFVEAGKLETWRALKPNMFETREQLSQWVSDQGVIEQWVINELGSLPRYRTDKAMRIAVDRALEHLKKNPSSDDESLMAVMRNTGLSERLVSLAAEPMRRSERWLRERAFLAGILKARKSMGPLALDIDHPFMIEMGRRAVGASQFLYDVANRPAMARTNFGKVWSRFKIWSWSSVAMRRQVFNDARDRGFALHSDSYQRMRRLAQADLFAISLVSFFPFSIFETAGLPAPYNWLKDTAEYFFGDEKEKETAFYGSVLGPASEALPSIFTRTVNAGNEIFDALVSEDKESFSRYPLVAMFPFGRMANDVYNSITQPMQAPKFLLGLPLRDLQNQRESIVRSNKLRETAPILLRQAIDGSPLKEIISAYEKEGYTATDARKAVNDAMKYGIVSRTKRGNAYWYYSTADDKTLSSAMEDMKQRSSVEFGIGDFMR